MLAEASDLAEIFLARADQNDDAVFDLLEEFLPPRAVFSFRNVRELVVRGGDRQR